MRHWLIIPVKPFDQAKSRLAAVLPDPERVALSAQLLEHTLRVATGTSLFEQIVVVSHDSAALAVAARFGAVRLVETLAGLNAAATQACNHANAAGADAVLLLPSDLPRLCAEDLQEVVDAFSSHSPTVVLAPSRDGGTNALMFPLPAPFTLAFGANSHHTHRILASAAGCTVVEVHRATLAFDLDSPADLQEFLADPACRLPTKSANTHNTCKMPY